MDEDSKEVIEKVLECVRDLADEFGPAGIEHNVQMIMVSVDQLLSKEAKCQIKNAGEMEDSDEEEDSDEDDEDMDHDEIILGNSTDVL